MRIGSQGGASYEAIGIVGPRACSARFPFRSGTGIRRALNMQPAGFCLSYLPMTLSFVSAETAALPAHLGSTLRGAIGQALMQHEPEAYRYLYENRTREDNHPRDMVNPYVIVPPDLTEAVYHAGETLRFDLLLLGDAAQFAQPLFAALQQVRRLGLGFSRHPFELLKATHAADQRVVWESGRYHALAARAIPLPYRTLPDVTGVTLRTRTPLRIRRDGALLEAIDFPTIIRNGTRRVEAIASRYGGFADAQEIARIQSLSEGIATVRNHLEIKRMARYSNRLGEKMDFSGLVGTLQLEGALTPFVPWLYAAQVLHIGRNTTFGMGRIEVEFL